MIKFYRSNIKQKLTTVIILAILVISQNVSASKPTVNNSDLTVRHDYVRDDVNGAIAHLAGEIIEYAISNYEGDQWVDTQLIDDFTNKGKIYALHLFARDILAESWGGDLDSMTAAEVALAFAAFNGEWSVPEAQSHEFSHPGSAYSHNFDCRDFAALISGIATYWGLPSRMISLNTGTSSPYFSHVFTEVYGLQTFGATANNKWFLIDPGAGYTTKYLSSFTYKDIIRPNYSILINGVATAARMWEIGGWGPLVLSTGAVTGDGWGLLYSQQVAPGPQQFKQKTSWIGYYEAPYNYAYTNNPWGITVPNP